MRTPTHIQAVYTKTSLNIQKKKQVLSSGIFSGGSHSMGENGGTGGGGGVGSKASGGGAA